MNYQKRHDELMVKWDEANFKFNDNKYYIENTKFSIFKPTADKDAFHFCLEIKKELINLHSDFLTTIQNLKIVKERDYNQNKILDNLMIRFQNIQNRLMVIEAYTNDHSYCNSVNNSRFAVYIAYISMALGVTSIILAIISFC